MRKEESKENRQAEMKKERGSVEWWVGKCDTVGLRGVERERRSRE